MITLQRCKAQHPWNCKKSLFLQQALKVFGGVAGKLFNVFDEMRLVEKIVFVTDLGESLGSVQIVENRIKTHDSRDFFGRGADHFPEPLFKRALTDP